MCIHLVRVPQDVDDKCQVQVSEKEENVPNFCQSMLTAMSVYYIVYLAGNCTIGEKIVGTACELCPAGTYQNEKWQTSCKACGNLMTTARAGATSLEECNCEWVSFNVFLS